MRFPALVACIVSVLTLSGGVHSFAEGKTSAARLAPQSTEKCSMKEEATLNANFNKVVTDIAEAKPTVDEKIKEIKDLAAQSGVTGLDVTSLNYSINSNGGSDCQRGPASFQVYGNVSFKVLPADKAVDFLAVLSGKGYNVNFNANAYKQCGDAAYAD